jgi:ABC-type Fe3+ transport system permease subunit
MPQIPVPVTVVLILLAVIMFIASRRVRRRNGTAVTEQPARYVAPRQDAASLPVSGGKDQGRP